MKINNKRELQYTAIDPSVDIDYEDFVKICRECTREPCSITHIHTLPASDLLKFRKNFFSSCKNYSN